MSGRHLWNLLSPNKTDELKGMKYILFTHISIVNVIISRFVQLNNRYMYTPFGMIHDVDANFLSVLH